MYDPTVRFQLSVPSDTDSKRVVVPMVGQKKMRSHCLGKTPDPWNMAIRYLDGPDNPFG